MNDDTPIKEIFHPFREAKAPEGFTDKVMTRLQTETAPNHTRKSFLKFMGPTRWVCGGGLALAASLAIMVPRWQNPDVVAKTDLSIYLADSNQVEEEADLGTQIESYFL